MNFRLVFQSLGRIIGLLSLAMIPPLLLSYAFHEEVHIQFIIPIVILLIISAFSFFWKHNMKELKIRESVVIVVAAWLCASFFGALPFLIDHILPSFTDAFFESLSGFTATGSTVLTDIESVPKSVLFWRSETHWLGGMGIVVLAIVIFPSFRGNYKLFSSESPTSVDEHKLFPQIAMVAKSYWKIYLLFTLFEFLLLMPVMGWFDAVTHAFGTIAGGGFSTRNTSIAFFDSLYVEVVIMIFMIAGATSFILHYQALRGKFRYFKSSSFRIFMYVLLSASILIAFNLYLINQHRLTFLSSLREAIFQVVSIITTTGFATADFKYWPDFSIFLLILLMFVGGMSASTSGSIKIWRFEIIFKEIRRIFHRILHNRAVVFLRLNGRKIEPQMVQKVQIFVIAYIFVFLISGIILTAMGYEPATSFSAVAATLGNVGPGIGAIGPFDNFNQFSDIAKWILSFDMLLGRLEIWTVLSLFIPEFWSAV